MDSRRKRSAENLSWIVNSGGTKRQAIPADLHRLQPSSVGIAPPSSAVPMASLNIDEFGDMDDEEDHCPPNYLPDPSMFVRTPLPTPNQNLTKPSNLLNSLKLQYSHLQSSSSSVTNQLNVRGSFGRLQPTKEELQDFSHRALKSSSRNIDPSVYPASSGVSLQSQPLKLSPTPVPPPKSHLQLNIAGHQGRTLPDWFGALKYPVPNIESFVYDPMMGLRFDPSTGLHYDANARLFYNSALKIPLYWDALKQTYLHIETRHFDDKLANQITTPRVTAGSIRHDAGRMEPSDGNCSLRRGRSRSRSFERYFHRKGRPRSQSRSPMRRSRSMSSGERTYPRNERRRSSLDRHSTGGRRSRSTQRRYGEYSRNSLGSVSPGRSCSRGPVYRSASRERITRYRTRSRRSTSRLSSSSRDQGFEKGTRRVSSDRRTDHFTRGSLDGEGYRRSRSRSCEQPYSNYTSRARTGLRRSRSGISDRSLDRNDSFRTRRQYSRNRSASPAAREIEISARRGLESRRSPSRPRMSPLRRNDQVARRRHSDRREYSEDRRHHTRTARHNDGNARRNDREISSNDESRCSRQKQSKVNSDCTEPLSRKRSLENENIKSKTESSTKYRRCDDKTDGSTVRRDDRSHKPSKSVESTHLKSSRSRQRQSKSPVKVIPDKPTRENVDTRSRRSKWEKGTGSGGNSDKSKSPSRSVSKHSAKQKEHDQHDRKQKESCHPETTADNGSENSRKKISAVEKTVESEPTADCALTIITHSESLDQKDSNVNSEPSTDIVTSPSTGHQTEDARNIIKRKRQQRRSVLETEESNGDSGSSLLVKVIVDDPVSEGPEKRDKFRLEKNIQIDLVQSEDVVTTEPIIPPEELSLTIDSLLFNELRKAEKNSSTDDADQPTLVLETIGSEVAQNLDPSNPGEGAVQESREGLQTVPSGDVNSPNVDLKTFQLPSTDDPGMLESFIVIDDELDFSGDEDESTVEKSPKEASVKDESTITREEPSSLHEQKLSNDSAPSPDEQNKVDNNVVVEEKTIADMADGEWCVLDEVDDSNDNPNVSQHVSRQGSPEKETRDPPPQNAQSELSDVSSCVDASNENDEKVSIINSISDFDDKDVFTNEQALSDVSSIIDKHNDNADALSNISSGPEGFENRDGEKADGIESHSDAVFEEKEGENADDDFISDLLKEEEIETQHSESAHGPEESPVSEIKPLDTDPDASSSVPVVLNDCLSQPSTGENLTEVDVAGSCDLGGQSVDIDIPEESICETPKISCEESNTSVNPSEQVSEEAKSPNCEQVSEMAKSPNCEQVSEMAKSPNCDVSENPTSQVCEPCNDAVSQVGSISEKSEEPQTEKVDAVTPVLKVVDEDVLEETSQGAADDDCEFLGELSDDEVEIIPDCGPEIIELSDDERIETTNVSCYSTLDIRTLDELDQWIHGDLSSIKKRPVPESFELPNSAKFVENWAEIPLQMSDSSLIKRLTPDTHVTEKFFSQQPTNFILARADILTPAVLSRALVDTLRVRNVKFLMVKKNSAVDSGAPYNHCHIIFQTAEMAEKFYNSCKGTLPLFGITGYKKTAALNFSTGNWICPVCKKCNFTLNYFCFQCFSSKDGRAFSPIRLVGTETRMLGVIFKDPRIAMRNLYATFPELSSFMPVTGLLPVVDPITKLPTDLNAFEFETVSECADAFRYLCRSKPRNLKITVAHIELASVVAKLSTTEAPDRPPSSYIDLTDADAEIQATSNVGRPIPSISASTSKQTGQAKKNTKPPFQEKPRMKPFKPNGNPEFKYPPPRYANFRLEPLTGLYFDFQTGLYYHKSTDYFFNDDLCIYLKYDHRQSTYVKVNII